MNDKKPLVDFRSAPKLQTSLMLSGALIGFLKHRFKAVDRFIHIPAPFYAPGRTAVKNRRGKRKMISPLRCAG